MSEVNSKSVQSPKSEVWNLKFEVQNPNPDVRSLAEVQSLK